MMKKQNKNKNGKIGKETNEAFSYAPGFSFTDVPTDVLGSYTGIPIDEEMISKNVSGGKTYINLKNVKEIPTQDADDL